ncbi:MAG: hypothetical protein Ct9H300mP25_08840 [Acidobacteriota bacterium]|nr:MAG: hypothetical protein Ct9H300mP25_08840 [Acidobacteriota bacterium]
MIEGRATAKYVRGSPQKARLVLDLIRGKDVDKAMSTLRFARRAVAKDIEKVLRSAVANAQHKEGGEEDAGDLYVRECFADQGPTLKRIRAAPMGRAFRIIKRTSHLTVTVGQKPEKTRVVTRVGETDDEAVETKKAVKRSPVSGGRKKAATKKAVLAEPQVLRRQARKRRQRRYRKNLTIRLESLEYGTKSSSVWVSTWVQQNVAVAMVRRS